MAKINYPASSPYATTKQTDSYIGLYQHRAIRPHKDDKKITLNMKYQYRPDLLSNDLYGTPDYWWVFLVRNMNIIRDPIWDFEAGKTISFPSLEHLHSVAG